MKKTFSIDVPNKNRDRQVDAIKFEVKKYIARERRKSLPEGFDYWGFGCRIGGDVEQSKEVHVGEINTSISQLAAEQVEKFYLEILARPLTRKKKKASTEASEAPPTEPDV